MALSYLGLKIITIIIKIIPVIKKYNPPSKLYKVIKKLDVNKERLVQAYINAKVQ